MSTKNKQIERVRLEDKIQKELKEINFKHLCTRLNESGATNYSYYKQGDLMIDINGVTLCISKKGTWSSI